MSEIRNNTQAKQILDHLLAFGSITPMEAIQEYGCTRLSARIYELRHSGYEIGKTLLTHKNRFGHPVTYAKYLMNNDVA